MDFVKTSEAYGYETIAEAEEKALAVSLENGAKAALTILDAGVSEAANIYNGSHP